MDSLRIASTTMPPALPTSARSPQLLPATRPYGTSPADLSVDFDQPDRAALTTALVALCSEGEEPAFVARSEAAWDLTVSARIARLLRILELTTGDAALTVTLACPAPACGQHFEVGLPFTALAAEACSDHRENGCVVAFPIADRASTVFRVPTGRDLAAWRKSAGDHATNTVSLVLRSLSDDPATPVELSSEQLAALASAMEAADPLVAFAVETKCPHCRAEASIDVDLEEAALGELACIRREILRDVHTLATRYGWSEAEILAIPRGRRAEYRRLIADAEGSFA